MRVKKLLVSAIAAAVVITSMPIDNITIVTYAKKGNKKSSGLKNHRTSKTNQGSGQPTSKKIGGGIKVNKAQNPKNAYRTVSVMSYDKNGKPVKVNMKVTAGQAKALQKELKDNKITQNVKGTKVSMTMTNSISPKALKQFMKKNGGNGYTKLVGSGFDKKGNLIIKKDNDKQYNDVTLKGIGNGKNSFIIDSNFKDIKINGKSATGKESKQMNQLLNKVQFGDPNAKGNKSIEEIRKTENGRKALLNTDRIAFSKDTLPPPPPPPTGTDPKDPKDPTDPKIPNIPKPNPIKPNKIINIPPSPPVDIPPFVTYDIPPTPPIEVEPGVKIQVKPFMISSVITDSKTGTEVTGGWKDERDLSEIWDNPSVSATAKYYSKDKEMSYNHKIVFNIGTLMKITDDSGNVLGYDFEFDRQISTTESYTFTPSTIDAPKFNPIDLRTEVAMTNGELVNKGLTPGTVDIVGEFENYKRNPDGTDLQALNNNDKAKFRVKFTNGQLGIPTAIEGGIDILKEKPESKDIVPDTPVFWGLTGKIGGSNIEHNPKHSSIVTPDGIEHFEGTTINVARDYQGGEFSFRSIKPGTYELAPKGETFWFAEYKGLIKNKYGHQYIIMCDISMEKESELDRGSADTNAYETNTETKIKQPLVYIRYKVNTAGGFSNK